MLFSVHCYFRSTTPFTATCLSQATTLAVAECRRLLTASVFNGRNSMMWLMGSHHIIASAVRPSKIDVLQGGGSVSAKFSGRRGCPQQSMELMTLCVAVNSSLKFSWRSWPAWLGLWRRDCNQKIFGQWAAIIVGRESDYDIYAIFPAIQYQRYDTVNLHE